MADRAIAGAFGFTQDLLDRQGKALFGQGFSIQSSFDYSLSSSSGIQGNLDVVVPVYSFSSSSSDATPLRSGFLQNGITRWVDERGIQRSDARMGFVYRFTAGQNRANMFGLSALLQKNLEFDHQRLATGVDYAGIWGVASLTYFKPITDWQFNHLGYKERPLEGMDFDMQLKPTTAILFRTTVGRWKDPEGSGNWLTRGRVALEWQPHPYLKASVSFSSADIEVGTDVVEALGPGEGGTYSITVTPPSEAGIYRYAACVDRLRVLSGLESANLGGRDCTDFDLLVEAQ